MTVGVLVLDLLLHDCRSKKEKRSVVARVLNRIRSRYPVSVAEVGHLDLLQRCSLGCSMTGSHGSVIGPVFKKIEEDLYQSGLVEIINLEVEYIDYGEI